VRRAAPSNVVAPRWLIVQRVSLASSSRCSAFAAASRAPMSCAA
jgi:hypothetical protein